MIKSIMGMLLLLTLGCVQNKPKSNSYPTPHKNSYIGEWESVSLEKRANSTYGYRYFNLDESDWEIKFRLYLDSLQQNPVFEFRALGKYKIQGNSNVVEGSSNAYFGFDQKFITLLTSNIELANNFGFSSCELVKGVEKEITENGCSFLTSKSVCGQEYDLLKLEREQLFLGARPEQGDMCSEKNRPTSLNQPLKRIINK